MSEHKGQNYLHGAAILTAGVIVMKILGFLYKMPIGNILGDDGYSYFFTSYNVYNVFLTLSTAGLPIALARMVSEANAQGRVNQLRRTFSVAWRTFFWVGLFCSLIMALFPKLIAERIMNNPGAALSIRVMSPSVLLVCLVSAYRGYCQGFGDMVPTTVGQVLEVLVKVIVGLALAWFLMHENYGKQLGAAGAIFGVTAGSAAALLYMWLHKQRHYRDDAPGSDTPDPDGAILRRFLRIGIPIAVGASVLALLNMIDASLCMGRLKAAAGEKRIHRQQLMPCGLPDRVFHQSHRQEGKRRGHQDLRGLDAHRRRAEPADGRGPRGAGRADHEPDLPRRAPGRRGAAGHPGRRLGLRLPRSDGKRDPAGHRA